MIQEVDIMGGRGFAVSIKNQGSKAPIMGSCRRGASARPPLAGTANPAHDPPGIAVRLISRILY
jgi:hypothetical protein